LLVASTDPPTSIKSLFSLGRIKCIDPTSLHFVVSTNLLPRGYFTSLARLNFGA
jgi:hypothetical protein